MRKLPHWYAAAIPGAVLQPARRHVPGSLSVFYTGRDPTATRDGMRLIQNSFKKIRVKVMMRREQQRAPEGGYEDCRWIELAH